MPLWFCDLAGFISGRHNRSLLKEHLKNDSMRQPNAADLLIKMKSKEAFKVTYRHHLIKRTCLIIMVISIAFLFLVRLDMPNESGTPVSHKEESIYPIAIQGLRLQSFKGSRETVKAVAKELKVNPRKFFVFNIKPFNELTINNVTMEFYKSEEGQSGIDIGKTFDNFSTQSNEKSFSSKGFESGALNAGLITRGVINTLILIIHDKYGLSKVVKAPKAYLNFKKDEVIFLDATVKDIATKQIIKSRKMVFKNGGNEIRVPGSYVLLSSAGSQRGKGLKINL